MSIKEEMTKLNLIAQIREVNKREPDYAHALLHTLGRFYSSTPYPRRVGRSR